MRDIHRLFLQLFMNKGIQNAVEVKAFHKYACERFSEEYNEAGLLEVMRTINNNIKTMHLEIKKGLSEQTGMNFYALVQTSDTDITRLCSDYTVTELEFFKKLVERIVTESDDGSVSSTAALYLVENLEGSKKMSKIEAEELMKRMTKDKWLLQENGQISLAPRALMELDQYIMMQYPDHVVMCNMCNKLCIKGQCCAQCDVKLHLYCASRFFSNNAEPRCPVAACNAPWPHIIPNLGKRKDSTSSHPSTSTSGVNNTQPSPSEGRKRKLRN